MSLRSGPGIRFSDIRNCVPATPGIYEIYTNSGDLLKVGIASNLRKRLRRHAASLDSGLRFASDYKVGDETSENSVPADVISKGSILAKHLYFDRTLTSEYDLKTEQGRREFLLRHCFIRYEETQTREIARAKERELERSGNYRYQGTVVVR